MLMQMLNSGDSARNIIFQNRGSEKMRIIASGNVGIGTTSPRAGLQVSKGGTTLPAAGAATASAVFGNSSSDDNYGLAVGANSSGVGYISSQRTDGTATTYDLAIQPNGGDVGIGTTNPAAKLHVVDDSSANALAKIRVEGGATSGYAELAVQSSYARIIANGTLAIATTGWVSYFYAGGNTGMTLTTTGLGVGTTSPQKELDVYLGTSSAVASIGGTISAGEYAGLHFGYSETGNSLYRHSAIVFERDDAGFGDARGKIHLLNSPSGSASADLGDARLTILPTGNVGIGTTSPSDLFMVDGNARVTGILKVADGAYNSPSIAHRADEDTGIYFPANDNIAISTSAVERMRINSSGNVGIGTTNPSMKLVVDGGGQSQFITTDNHQRLFITSSPGHQSILYLGDTDSNSQGRVAYDNNTDDMYFNTASVEKMRITSAGNVGIGTTSPGAKLEVEGNSGGSPLFKVQDTQTTLGTKLATFIQTDGTYNPNLDISSTSTGILINSGFNTGIPGSFTLQSNGGSGYLAFNTNSANERMRITAAGNVGIGVTNAIQKT